MDWNDELQYLGDGEQNPYKNLNDSGWTNVSTMDCGVAESVGTRSVCRHSPVQASLEWTHGQEHHSASGAIFGQSTAATHQS